MKNMKAWIVSVVVICVVMVVCGCAIAESSPDYGEFYPRLTVVFDTEEIEGTDCRIIYCVDKQQNVWSFYDDDNEWEKGDIANLLMWNLSEDEEEHEIVEVYWDGYTEDIDEFFHVTDWR